MNAVLRLLFALVIIDERRGKRSSVDDSRIDIQPNPPVIRGGGQPRHLTTDNASQPVTTGG
jgi:hypothetical protein